MVYNGILMENIGIYVMVSIGLLLFLAALIIWIGFILVENLVFRSLAFIIFIYFFINYISIWLHSIVKND